MPHVATRKMVDTLGSNGVKSVSLKSLKKQDIAVSLFEMYDREKVIPCRLYEEITNDARLFCDRFVSEATNLSQEEYDQIIEAEIDINLPKAVHLLSRLQMMQRCSRAYSRLLVVPWEEDGVILFTDGDEDEQGQPFLPNYLRSYMKYEAN